MRRMLVVVLLCFSGLVLLAQDVENGRRRTKVIKKKVKQEREPYTPSYNIKDSDGDGVPDGRDKCHNSPRGQKVTPFGCPVDTDFDGLYDFEDACIEEPGVKDNYGCPWGDKDSDGILDNEDKCPTIAGIQKFAGCPDNDKDGIVDFKDRCPEMRGPRKNYGCPYGDRDQDNVTDDVDLCPDIPGDEYNRGCPKQKEEVEKVLKKAFDNLLFETGKDVIMTSSYSSLNELAEVLKKYSNAKLHLEGHTDNVGDDLSNQILSEARARAVKAYLVNKGIDEFRIYNKGYGETRPKAENDTENGRQLNRRVEMNILYD